MTNTREARKPLASTDYADLIGLTLVRVAGHADVNSRIVGVRVLPVGTPLAGPRGGARVVRRAGELLAFDLANGRKPVARRSDTVTVLVPETD